MLRISCQILARRNLLGREANIRRPVTARSDVSRFEEADAAICGLRDGIAMSRASIGL